MSPSDKEYIDAIDFLITLAISYRRKMYAIDANLYKLGLHTIYTERAYKKYQKITKAIETVRKRGATYQHILFEVEDGHE